MPSLSLRDLFFPSLLGRGFEVSSTVVPSIPASPVSVSFRTKDPAGSVQATTFSFRAALDSVLVGLCSGLSSAGEHVNSARSFETGTLPVLCEQLRSP